MVKEKPLSQTSPFLASLKYSSAFRRFFNLAKESGFITPLLLNSLTTAKTLESVQKMQALSKEILSKKTILDQSFDSDIYKLDGQTYHKKLTKQYRGFFSRFFSGDYKRIIGDIKLCKKDGKKPKYKVAVEAMDNLRVYQGKSQEFSDIEKSIKDYLGSAYQGVNTDFALLISQLQELADIHSLVISFENLAKLAVSGFAVEQSSFDQIAGQYENAFVKYSESVERITACFDLSEYNVQDLTLQALVAKCQGCIDNIDKIDNWCEFSKLLQTLKSLELRAFIDYSIEKKIGTNQLVLTYKKAFYMQWVDAVLHESPVLISLARVPHDEAVKHFKEKDELNFEINKAKIKAIFFINTFIKSTFNICDHNE